MLPSGNTLMARFVAEAGRPFASYLHSSRDGLYVSKDGTNTLFYLPRRRFVTNHIPRPDFQWSEDGVSFSSSEPSVSALGRFLGNRHTNGGFLLNGDGFEDRVSTQNQTRLRDLARAAFAEEGAPNNRKVMVIPYLALTASGIVYESIRPIQVTEDVDRNVIHDFEYLRPHDFNTPKKLRDKGFTEDDTTALRPYAARFTGEVEGDLWRITVSRANRHTTPEDHIEADWQDNPTELLIWRQPTNARPGWQTCNTGIVGTHYIARWNEHIHMLGACVFFGVGRDGKRHRWISAFDVQELDPLYFLAMLPDKGACHNYEQAIEMLAPDIVHKAREAGRAIYRQGDVFAIETTLTDEEIYDEAATRVRRAIALQRPDGVLQTGSRLAAPAEGEVVEDIDCPFCDGHTLKAGCGSEARRAISIYATGHTATEVVVKEDGRTFLKGTLFHDPVLEDPTRTNADHMNVDLLPAPTNTGGGWFLAVRNTVPRATVFSSDTSLTARLRAARCVAWESRNLTSFDLKSEGSNLPTRFNPPEGFTWGRFEEVALGDFYIDYYGYTSFRDDESDPVGTRQIVIPMDDTDFAKQRESLKRKVRYRAKKLAVAEAANETQVTS